MLSIIIPCYNGESQIKSGNIKKVSNYMDNLNIPYEIIVINDGSKDNSLEELLKIKDSNIKIISYQKNQGKGFAIKTGMLAANGDVLFMDIDLSTQLNAIDDILKHINDYDIIIGSRNLKNSIGGKDKPFFRNIMSVFSHIITRLLIDIRHSDTQCGFKYISHKYVKLITDKQIINRWAFDVEYLYIAKINKLKVLEIPVIWKNDDNSAVSPVKASINFINDLIKIRKNKKKYSM